MRLLFVVLGLSLVNMMPPIAAAQEATPPAGFTVIGGSRTDMHYIVPFTPDGLHPDFTATATEEGTCGFGSSAALGRPDAWDCISDSDVVYDPCFENPYLSPDEPGQVACFDSPFSTEVVVLTLTEPLVREKEAASKPDPVRAPSRDDTSIVLWDLPWALELANGEQCTLLRGTLTVIAGQVSHYGCTNGGMVIGETYRAQPTWTVSYLPEGDYVTSLVDVVAAWS